MPGRISIWMVVHIFPHSIKWSCRLVVSIIILVDEYVGQGVLWIENLDSYMFCRVKYIK